MTVGKWPSGVGATIFSSTWDFYFFGCVRRHRAFKASTSSRGRLQQDRAKAIESGLPLPTGLTALLFLPVLMVLINATKLHLCFVRCLFNKQALDEVLGNDLAACWGFDSWMCIGGGFAGLGNGKVPIFSI